MVFKNTLFLFLMQGVNYLAPILLIPFYSNVLGVSAYGNIALWLSITQFAYVVTDFGFMTLATRDIAIISSDKNRVSRLVSSIYCLKIFLFLIVSIATVAYGFIVNVKYEVVIFSIITIFSQCYQPVWFFHGIEKMKLLAFYFSFSKILFLVLVLTFVNSTSDWSLVLLYWSLSQLLGFLVSNYQYKFLGFGFYLPSFYEVKSIFYKSVHFFISRLSLASYTSFNMIILGSVGTGHYLAAFAICDQIFKAGQAFTSPVTQALYPFLQRTKDWALYFKMTCISLILLFLALSTFLASYDVIFELVFNAQPDGIDDMLPAFLVLILVNFLARNLGNPLFGPIDKLNIANNTVILGATLHLTIVSILYFSIGITPLNLTYCVLFTEFFILLLRVALLFRYKDLFRVQGKKSPL